MAGWPPPPPPNSEPIKLESMSLPPPRWGTRKTAVEMWSMACRQSLPQMTDASSLTHLCDVLVRKHTITAADTTVSRHELLPVTRDTTVHPASLHGTGSWSRCPLHRRNSKLEEVEGRVCRELKRCVGRRGAWRGADEEG